MKTHALFLPASKLVLVATLATFVAPDSLRADLWINVESNIVAISWNLANVQLQQANQAVGPWSVVTNATNPHRVVMNPSNQFFRLEVTGPVPGPRTQDVPPLAAVVSAVNQFKLADPHASFTFFNGHVDSFATRPQKTIPSYASNVLASLSLPLTTREPVLLAAPANTPKPARDLDADLNIALPLLPEAEDGQPPISTGASDPFDPPPSFPIPVEARTQPPQDPHTLVPWTRPDPATLASETRAAEPILRNFLTLHPNVFELSSGEFATTMNLENFQVGAYFRKATFKQDYAPSKPLVDGRTLVLFDANWNVINISRMITTPAKLAIEPLISTPLTQTQAVGIAKSQPIGAECAGAELYVVRAELGVDHIRRMHVWDVELATADAECHWRTTIHANSGTVMNVSDQRQLGYTDAKVNRWYYPNGNVFTPQRIITTNMYTRSDRRLEHDFFWVMNDHRCEGDPETTCVAITNFATLACNQAYGTNDGSYIRATIRTDRNFSGYQPASASEAFAETHTYYWARAFSQWLKPALDALGVLPDSGNDYPRVLIITDICNTRAWCGGNFAVNTESDKGEGGTVIRIPHRPPADVKRHNDSCEGGACYDTPSNIAHELNHFFLGTYFGVSSGTDCGKSKEGGAIHEGVLGTAIPQAFWHSYYGVGYDPNTDFLYFANQSVGRVHVNDGSRMTYDDLDCNWSVANKDTYTAGRVAGQVLWEIYHGKKFTGEIMGNMARPATDTDFNILAYWAADLAEASNFPDLYEYCKRFMEIIDKYGQWPQGARLDYYNAFKHHSLHWTISNELLLAY